MTTYPIRMSIGVRQAHEMNGQREIAECDDIDAWQHWRVERVVPGTYRLVVDNIDGLNGALSRATNGRDIALDNATAGFHYGTELAEWHSLARAMRNLIKRLLAKADAADLTTTTSRYLQEA